MKNLRRLCGWALAFVVAGLLTGCGGGNASGTSTAPSPPTVNSVTVSCTPTTVATGATSQCSATVQGTGSYSAAVTWTASAGTIDSSGLLTAPGSGGSVTVTATSTQDTTQSGSATVTVQPSSSITSVSVSCAPATVVTGATSQCSATVQGTGSYSSAVTWRTSAGTINSSGLLTAPGSSGSVTVTETSTQDTSKSGSTTVTVQTGSGTSSITSVSVSCTPSTVVTGATSQCSATVQGTGSYSSAVTWRTSTGTITSSGLLTAPGSSGSVTVTATSSQDTTKSGSATVTVQPSSTITSVAVSCTPTTVAPSATSQCSATVQGTGNYSAAVTWKTSAGTIDSSGLLTAPGSSGSVTVTATSTQDTTKSGTATVTVQPSSTITSVSVSCTPTTVAPSAASQCSATVQGTGNYSTGVSWTASSGNISAAGSWTAPTTTGSVTITAKSTQDSTKSGTATVIVQTPTSQHVVLVMEENQSYSSVVGNTSSWPNLNNLIAHGALATNYYADTHPSIGNYFMLTTGQVLTNNDSSTQVWNVDNIARRILSSGVAFRVYAEGITQGYLGGNTGLYVIRHNPFAMLSDVAGNTTVANQVLQPFTQFSTDVAASNLPAYSFVVPNIDDDAHNGTPQQADSWLQTNVVDVLQNDPAFQPGGDGVLIVDFDESVSTDLTHGGGHVAAVLWGPGVRTGYRQTSSTVYQHESLLATMMELLGLQSPMGAAATTPLMNEFFAK